MDKARDGSSLTLNMREKIFLKLFCFPPPGKQDTHYDTKYDNDYQNALEIFDTSFGKQFFDSIRGKTVLDLGCGVGAQVLGLALHGAQKAIGAELRPLYTEAAKSAVRLGIADRVQFTQNSLSEIEPASCDVVISLNSFEHFHKPDQILAEAYRLLRPGGRFFITFSPPWLNPFGVHQYYMIRRPWAHFFFSEKTIMRVRRLYREDNAMRYEQLEGGLNQMTVRKFLNYVNQSRFSLDNLLLTSIRYTPSFLAKLPWVREFVISRVSAVLSK